MRQINFVISLILSGRDKIAQQESKIGKFIFTEHRSGALIIIFVWMSFMATMYQTFRGQTASVRGHGSLSYRSDRGSPRYRYALLDPPRQE